MQRKYSLRRLFFVVTVLCVIAAFVAAYPQTALRVCLFASLFLPALAVCSLFAFVTRGKRAVIIATLVGAVAACVFAPVTYVHWSTTPTWWDLYTLAFQNHAIPAVVGAVVAGLVACVVVAGQSTVVARASRHVIKKGKDTRLRESTYPDRLDLDEAKQSRQAPE